jgi:hypothetical protein
VATFPLKDWAANRQREDTGQEWAGRGPLGKRSSAQVTKRVLTCRLGYVLPRCRRLLVSLLSREEVASRQEGGSGHAVALTLPVASLTSAHVPASKMAAAVSGVLGLAGWRILQLRCLPGEGAAEPGSREDVGRGCLSAWAGCGAEKVVAAAR